MSSSSNSKARMNVHLTDAPANYEEVNIDVQGLRIHYTPFSSDTAASNGEWIDMPVEATKINLLELQNGVDMLLASEELDPGYYRELRLLLGSDNDVVVDGTTHELKVPSGQSSGYKIKFDAELEEGEEIDVTIDFDAARSVHQAGKSGKFILKPVLRAFVSSGEDVETGSIVGVVEPVDADPTVYAIMDDDTAATSMPNEDGSFLLQGLEEGNYELFIEAGNEDYNDTTLENISVVAGDENDVGTITLDQN